MTTVFTPAANLYIPGTVNRQVISTATSGTALSGSYTPSSTGSGLLLLGVDMTAVQANPVQVFANIWVDTQTYIYWDSQSTGEGNGVTFAWRGQLWIKPGQPLHIAMQASATILLSGVAWGLQGQLTTAVNYS